MSASKFRVAASHGNFRNFPRETFPRRNFRNLPRGNLRRRNFRNFPRENFPGGNFLTRECAGDRLAGRCGADAYVVLGSGDELFQGPLGAQLPVGMRVYVRGVTHGALMHTHERMHMRVRARSCTRYMQAHSYAEARTRTRAHTHAQTHAQAHALMHNAHTRALTPVCVRACMRLREFARAPRTHTQVRPAHAVHVRRRGVPPRCQVRSAAAPHGSASATRHRCIGQAAQVLHVRVQPVLAVRECAVPLLREVCRLDQRMAAPPRQSRHPCATAAAGPMHLASARSWTLPSSSRPCARRIAYCTSSAAGAARAPAHLPGQG